MAGGDRTAGSDRTAGPDGTGLSADRAVAAVRIHLDRVHDAVLRTGCAPADAVEVVRATALALVDRAAGAPSSADRAVGRWFADALAAGRAAVGASPPGLPGDAEQQRLQAALDRLPEQQRLAVLLRDAYDLPLRAVAAALGTDAASAERVLRDARQALPSGEALAGLSVLGMAPAARGDVLREVEDLAHRRLPQARPGPGSRRSTSVAATGTAPSEPPPRLLSPLLAGLSVVLAVLAGIGVGLVLASQDAPRTVANDGALPPGVAFVTPRPSVTALPSPPTVDEVRPRTDVVVISPSPLPTPTPTPTPSPTSTAVPTLALSPASGDGGTTIAVTGTGFAPGDQVRIDLLDADGVATGSSAVAVADDRGSITASVVVQDPPGDPGPRTITATVGDAPTPVASADFTVQ